MQPATSPPAQPAVSFVVVTHESAADISNCLSSIYAAAPAHLHEVIVVDNRSTDGTADIVRDKFPDVQLVSAPQRQGFSANCNLGVAHASGSVYFFFNPDAMLTPGATEVLVERIVNQPDVGIVAPALTYPDGRRQFSARRFPEPMTTILRRTPLRILKPTSAGEERHLMSKEEITVATEVDWFLGAAMVMRAEFFAALGGFDERFRLYCEDIDLCWRTWASGHKVVQDPAAMVTHQLGELTRHKFMTRATWWHTQSMARFVMKNGIGCPPNCPSSRQGHVSSPA